jgi:hypothetical protein
VRDLVAVILCATTTNVLVVHPSVPARTVKEPGSAVVPAQPKSAEAFGTCIRREIARWTEVVTCLITAD